MKTKKGITLAILVITIIVLVILTTVTVTTGTKEYNKAKLVKLQSEMSQIELLMNNYVTRKSGDIQFSKINLDVSNMEDTSLTQFSDETITGTTIEMYVIDLYEIDAEESTYGTGKLGDTDRYLYSAKTGKVYYEKGLKVGSITYHRVNNINE